MVVGGRPHPQLPNGKRHGQARDLCTHVTSLGYRRRAAELIYPLGHPRRRGERRAILWPPSALESSFIELIIQRGPRLCGGEICHQRERNGPLTA